MSVLKTILKTKLLEIEHSDIEPVENVKRDDIRSLKSALSNPGISVIAEIKMKSPSEGNIFPNADPVQIARDYEAAGAAAISVITESHFFGGSLEILRSVREAVNIPVLRKDFILSTAQISETNFVGGDAFLLIMEAVESSDLFDLFSFGKNLGLESLVEFHEIEKASKSLAFNAPIIGVNCRNLDTMNTDLNHFRKAFPILPHDSVKVAESGIKDTKDLNYVAELGYDAALIGTSLMKTGNPGSALEFLIEGLA